MICQQCRDVGLMLSQHPRVYATVGELVTVVFCNCAAAEARRSEGSLPDVVMGGLAQAFLTCFQCGGSGITPEGDFCTCDTGRERAAVSKTAAGIPRGRAPSARTSRAK